MSDLNNLINNIVNKAVADATHVLRCNIKTLIEHVQELEDKQAATYALASNAIDRVKALESSAKPIAPPTPEEVDDLFATLLQLSQPEAEPEEPMTYDDLVGIVRQVVQQEIGAMLGSGRTVTVTISD